VIALLQRVREARVEWRRHCRQIGPGLLVLVCAEPADTEAQAAKLVDKLLKLRIFSDDAGKMNRSVQDVGGGLLVVSSSRWRPTPAAATGPASAVPRRPRRCCRARRCTRPCCAWRASVIRWSPGGRFGADMQVHLVNDGPGDDPAARDLPRP
jgi:D-aminoacyl-tRNA deacylase